MSAKRYFNNEWLLEQGVDDVISVKAREVHVKEEIKVQFRTSLLDMVGDIERASNHFDKRDISVYTGLSGYALLYLHLYKILEDQKYLNKASEYITSALKSLKNRRITFLCGDAGPLAIAAVVYDLSDMKERCDSCIQQLIAMARSIANDDSETYDELLYGRAGYLYSLLYVKRNVASAAIPTDVIVVTVRSIIESGKRSSCQRTSGPPLMYSWHGSEYIGAAHGYIGILFLLLQTDSYKPYEDLIKSTIDFLLDMQYPSGNFPSSFGSSNDRLIHWCHGAPGGVYLMIKAYEIFKDERYLESAKKASDAVWERGLIKKGYGICHGAAGNGYGFLAMYKLTQDPKYFYRAARFGLWCCGYRHRVGLNTPDRPYSMFEGIAGAAYFLADVLKHNDAKFPAFEL